MWSDILHLVEWYHKVPIHIFQKNLRLNIFDSGCFFCGKISKKNFFFKQDFGNCPFLVSLKVLVVM